MVGAPGDEPVGPDQDRAVGGVAAVAGPGGAGVEQVAVQVADAYGVQRPGVGQLGGGPAPVEAVLSGDEQEAARPDQVVDREATAGVVVQPGVRQRMAAGTCSRVIDLRGRGRDIRSIRLTYSPIRRGWTRPPVRVQAR